MISEDDLYAAADTIDETSDSELQCGLQRLIEARKARTTLQAASQQSELEGLELDEVAYNSAREAAANGDLAGAVRLYRLAAINDYADAPLRLAQALDALAEEYLATPESLAATRERTELVLDAASWYLKAYAAGDSEAADYLDNLVDRHSEPGIAAPGDADARTRRCALGGLRVVTKLERAEAKRHCCSCPPCRDELAELSRPEPSGKDPATEALGPAPTDGSCCESPQPVHDRAPAPRTVPPKPRMPCHQSQE